MPHIRSCSASIHPCRAALSWEQLPNIQEFRGATLWARDKFILTRTCGPCSLYLPTTFLPAKVVLM